MSEGEGVKRINFFSKDDSRKRKNILFTPSAAQLFFIEQMNSRLCYDSHVWLFDISFLISFPGGTGRIDFALCDI